MDARLVDERSWPEVLAAWPEDKATLTGLHAQPETDLLVASTEKHPVGYGVVRWGGTTAPNAREAFPNAIEVNHLWVLESGRGQGAGTALIKTAEREARSRGHQQLMLRVGDDNPDARRLYQRLGYRSTGVWDTTTYSYRDTEGHQHQATETDEVLIKDL